MITNRDQMSQEEREKKSSLIELQLIKLHAYQIANTIFAYVNFRSEVITKSFIKKAVEDGKRIAVPVCKPKDKILLPCEISGINDLVPGTWGILEPPKDNLKTIDAMDIDLVVVPGLAFDHSFHRLGYGA